VWSFFVVLCSRVPAVERRNGLRIILQRKITYPNWDMLGVLGYRLTKTIQQLKKILRLRLQSYAIKPEVQKVLVPRTVKPTCILNNTQYTHFHRVKGNNSLEKRCKLQVKHVDWDVLLVRVYDHHRCIGHCMIAITLFHKQHRIDVSIDQPLDDGPQVNT
jgi:hypothetical protein